MAVVWDPKKYAQFGNLRNRPFFDLTGRILADEPHKVVDLGCGPGDMTAALAQRWGSATVQGFDSSAEMIAAAKARSVPANLSFSVADVADWSPDPDVDVVVTNAVLQWVPGHREMLGKWLAALPHAAWFAMQVPGNFEAPSHRLMRELAASERWRQKLTGVLRHSDAVAEPGEYLDIFMAAGMRADAWETTYQQVLPGADPVLNWVRGTGLRPILNALAGADPGNKDPGSADSNDSAAFEAEYAALLDLAYPARDYGTIFPFRRIFVVGQKI